MSDVAELFGLSVPELQTIYWWGVGVVVIVTSIFLLVTHYKQYYKQLQYFIEKDGIGNFPTHEIDSAELITAMFIVGAVGICWPAGVAGALLVFVLVTMTKTVRFLVNLPHQIVQKLLVKKYRGRMLTSPSSYLRVLAELHSKKKPKVGEANSLDKDD
jgi:membrane protein implicated in regulation of membrane protease activity